MIKEIKGIFRKINMVQKIKNLVFTNKTPQKILISNEIGILNFQNLYSVYLFNKELNYRKAITFSDNFVFPDGKVISLFLRTKQIRGATFTRNFFENRLDSGQRHFFIGPSEENLKELVKKFTKLKNYQTYNPPYIKEVVFSENEIKIILNKLEKFKPHYIWVCVGNPKQEILANRLYKEYLAFYFVVGAAMDFLLEKKKEAPKFIQKMGIEWLYRLVTDFNHTWKKSLGSFIGLWYLCDIKLKEDKVS